MGIEFTAYEAFAIAAQIERQASEYYLRAADACPDTETGKLFLYLARMETDHILVFEAMKEQMPAPQDPPDLSAGERNWPRLAGLMIDDIEKDLGACFARFPSPPDILRGAMKFEQDTIVFLLSLKEMVKAPAEKARMDELLREEMGHLVTLGSQLASLKA